MLHGQFYPVLDQVIVEDCFRQAVLKYGVPESVYFDNGKQYRTKWMTRACSKLFLSPVKQAMSAHFVDKLDSAT